MSVHERMTLLDLLNLFKKLTTNKIEAKTFSSNDLRNICDSLS